MTSTVAIAITTTYGKRLLPFPPGLALLLPSAKTLMNEIKPEPLSEFWKLPIRSNRKQFPVLFWKNKGRHEQLPLQEALQPSKSDLEEGETNPSAK